MNKLLLIPLAVMFILSVIGFAYQSGDIASYTHETQGAGNFTGDESTENVDIPEGEEQDFSDFWASSAGETGAIVILIAALALGIVSGVSILGSGLSQLSQVMIFKSVTYFGLWGVLTVFSRDIIFAEDLFWMGTLIWVGLTTVYMVGFSTTIGMGGDG